ncbi:MAG: Gfo/Idh/MocA family oxidoreductase [Planctomycetes bacterium]|nr:Gfo/Idh/MocA family oxidoreductase [Planctomycetota bacterium]
MADRVLRVGFVGAGENTRRRHIPGLRGVAGVELAGVVNRTAESTARVAQDFGIAKQYPRWQDLVADDQIDAVVVGTWPNLHSEVTCAALAAGKHVLCEARMARDVAEARAMMAASQAHPDKIAMLVPSPFGLECDTEVDLLLFRNFIGDLREIVVIGADDQFQDYTRYLHWRQDAAISGVNVLTLGILHETLSRWVPQPTRLFAQTQTFEPVRPNPVDSGDLPVTVPDSVQVLTQYASGARGIYHFSGTTLLGPGKQIHLYGSLGTIKILFGEHDRVFVGRKVDTELREITVPPEKLGGWRVEAEFVAAIRGEGPVRRTDFAAGLQYMEFTEAVSTSARDGMPVNLPQSDEACPVA